MDAASFATFIGFVNAASAQKPTNQNFRSVVFGGRMTRVYVQSGSIEVVVQAPAGDTEAIVVLTALRFILKHFPVWAETLSRCYVDIQVGKLIGIRKKKLEELVDETLADENVPSVVEEDWAPNNLTDWLTRLTVRRQSAPL